MVYVALILMSAATCPRSLLVQDYSYLQDINRVPAFVMLGIFAATLSASLSCLIGASRILQAISRDNLLGDWFLFFSKESGEPVRAVIASWFMVQCVLFIGSVNAIAPIVTMLYLLTYGTVNFACFILDITGAPNFRPSFRYFSWKTALMGAVSCISIMFVVNLGYALGAIGLMVMLFIFINFRSVAVDWGDVTQPLIFHQVRKYLLRLDTSQTVKFWRPQVVSIGGLLPLLV